MRYDIDFDALRFDADASAKAAIVRPENLVYARFETTLAFNSLGTLDLVFASPDGVAIVPWLKLEGMMLIEREESPIIWPSWMRYLDADTADAIEARVEPWLRSRVVARYENGSDDRYFDTPQDLRELIAYAREAGWLGAAPSSDVLQSIAPHRYAWRFCEGADVVLRGEGAANGAALLGRRAASVTAALADPAAVAAARRWFGLDLYVAGELPARAWDVYVGPREFAPEANVRIILDGDAREPERRVSVAYPLVPATPISFDLDDAPEVAAFSVSAPARAGRLSTIAEPAAQGGSAGRIALVVREDCMRMTDADTDAVRVLARLLGREGFIPQIVAPSHFEPEGYDVVHVFGYRYAGAIEAKLERAAERGIPIVATPYADDAANEHGLQASNLRALVSANDDVIRREYLEALARRKLTNENRPDAQDDRSIRRFFELARIVFVTCVREEQHIRSAFGFAGSARRVAAYASPLPGAADVSALVGLGDFVLARGPVDARSNHYLIARAAANAGLPLVVCGAVADTGSYQQLLTALGDLAIWSPAGELTAEQEAGLVCRARVVADVSWSGHGLHSLATAAGARCSLVVSSNGYGADLWGLDVASADPASVDSIEAALRVAWDEASERGPRLAAKTASACDPFAALVATVSGYQAAAGSPVRS